MMEFVAGLVLATYLKPARLAVMAAVSLAALAARGGARALSSWMRRRRQSAAAAAPAASK